MSWPRFEPRSSRIQVRRVPALANLPHAEFIVTPVNLQDVYILPFVEVCPKRRWGSTIKIDLKEMEWIRLNWSFLVQCVHFRTHMKMVMNLWIPYES